MALTVSLDDIVASGSLLLAIKPHWLRVRLGDVGQVLNGYAFKAELFTREGGMPLIRIRDVGSAASETLYSGEFEERYVVNHGDLLVGMDGDFNCARWRGPRSLLNQRVCKITVDESLYLPRFLDYVLPGYLKAINDATSSITVKHLSSRTIQDIPLPLPPMGEQREIVAELEKQFSRLDEAVANLQRVKANLKRYKASVLKAAVEGRLVETEGGWRQSTLGDEAAIIGGLTKNQKRNDLPLKLPYLRVANVYANELRLDEIEYIGVAERELEKLLVRKGDLLVVEGNGSPDQIGRVALWNDSIPNCVHQNHLIKARFGETVLPEWALIWMLSPVGRHEIEQVSASTSGLHTLSVGKVSRLPIGVPPKQEQARIVAEVDRHLSIIREVEAEVDTNLKRAQALRQATLSKAFSPHS